MVSRRFSTKEALVDDIILLRWLAPLACLLSRSLTLLVRVRSRFVCLLAWLACLACVLA